LSTALLRRPSTLLAYTTLFRSIRLLGLDRAGFVAVRLGGLTGRVGSGGGSIGRPLSVGAPVERVRAGEPAADHGLPPCSDLRLLDRKSTRLNSGHVSTSYAVLF